MSILGTPERILNSLEKNSKVLGSLYGYIGGLAEYGKVWGTDLPTSVIDFHSRLVTDVHFPNFLEMLYELKTGTPSTMFKANVMGAVISWLISKADLHPVVNKLASFGTSFLSSAAVGNVALAGVYAMTHSPGGSGLLSVSGAGGGNPVAYPLGVNKASVYGASQNVFGVA